jgi:phage N-6-adenine-methyltransferase
MGYIGASPVAERDSNDWHTPARYIEAARSVLGSIDLDPFSSAKANETVKAARYFTVEDDAITMKGAWTPLLDDYPRDKAFVNPPYSRGVIDAAIARFLVELPRLSAAIVLTNNATETQWFQRLMKRCNAACFADHRIAFESPDNKQESGNTRGQVFFFFGPVYARMKFAKVFKKIGQISEMTPDLAEEINEPPTTPITAIRDSILDFPNPVAVGSKSNLALLIKSNDLEIEQLLESLLAELPRGTGKTKDQIRKLFRGMRREIAAMKKHMEAAS